MSAAAKKEATMSKHTPGPWEIGATGAIVGQSYRVAAVNKLNPKGDADATLIAAAPELAEALRVLLFALPHVAGSERAVEAARAALRKAGVE